MSKPATRATETPDVLDGEIDFDRFGPMRRGAFAGADEPGGPSLLALWEMPELPPSVTILRRGNPGGGRARTTVARSVRLPAELWAEVEAKAKLEELNVHQAMRAAILTWLRRAG